MCWKPPPGQAAADAQKEIAELVGDDGFRYTQDKFDYGWLLLDDSRPRGPGDQDPHGQLDAAGERLGPPAAVLGVRLRPGSGRRRRRPALPARVPLQARDLLPVRPVDGEKERRDTELELRIRTMVGADLPVETDLSRWFPLWDMPVA